MAVRSEGSCAVAWHLRPNPESHADTGRHGASAGYQVRRYLWWPACDGVAAHCIRASTIGGHALAGQRAFSLLFLATLTVDGLNSLMTDLGNYIPYTASNDLRLITGWLTGVAIGSVLLMVTGMTLGAHRKSKTARVAKLALAARIRRCRAYRHCFLAFRFQPCFIR